MRNFPDAAVVNTARTQKYNSKLLLTKLRQWRIICVADGSPAVEARALLGSACGGSNRVVWYPGSN